MVEQFSKKDIEKARKELWLNEAKKALGNDLQSLDNVEITFKTKTSKKHISLGKMLEQQNKRFHKPISVKQSNRARQHRRRKPRRR